MKSTEWVTARGGMRRTNSNSNSHAIRHVETIKAIWTIGLWCERVGSHWGTGRTALFNWLQVVWRRLLSIANLFRPQTHTHTHTHTPCKARSLDLTMTSAFFIEPAFLCLCQSTKNHKIYELTCKFVKQVLQYKTAEFISALTFFSRFPITFTNVQSRGVIFQP